MEKTTVLWGGFQVTYGPRGDGYRALAVPRHRAKGLGLSNISADAPDPERLLISIRSLISEAWKPFIADDARFKGSLPSGSFKSHASECHRCHHGVHSSFMPVCEKCQRSFCFNCGACMCGYSGPRKG